MSGGFDIIVVGAGHAGIEAAHAAAKLGGRTCLVTLSKETIGEMSCNPAIGGLAKGQIAREVDALGGLMGLAIDATALQFKMLNRSKGPAVQSPRAQADKHAYKEWMRQCLEATEGLTIVADRVEQVVVESGQVRGVVCEKAGTISARAVVVTTGTFLRGVMHIGSEQIEGGRRAEPASNALSESLEQAGLELGRLKTGTPVRLDADTIDYDKVKEDRGDEKPLPFSFLNDTVSYEAVPCWTTYTNERIHELIRDNLDRAPLYTGQIKSTGPRYCPSIESKIMRFADKDRHQVFLEPEDRNITTIYCNGISTSLPRDIQEQMLRMMPGTERARIVHWAYAIEYDYCPPTQLRMSLETRQVSGLFLAGQINGTSGYEEAAGQGIIAGINAVRKLDGKEAVVLSRDQAYIGVMIDDLLTKGLDEPYRMFTSRAEYRLALRSDNADRRLTTLAGQVGLVDDRRWQRFREKVESIERLEEYLRQNRAGGVSLLDRLTRPDGGGAEWLGQQQFVREQGFRAEVVEAVAIDAKYAGYLDKQARLVESMRKLDSCRLPESLDYGTVEHLRAEARQKLSRFKPATLGQAGRISGITPADVTVLGIHLKKYFGEKTCGTGSLKGPNSRQKSAKEN